MTIERKYNYRTTKLIYVSEDMMEIISKVNEILATKPKYYSFTRAVKEGLLLWLKENENA